jgi:hypothetical protein
MLVQAGRNGGVLPRFSDSASLARAEAPGGVQASFDFRGAKNTGAGRMLTVTLTNDLDGLVYG